LVEIDAYFRELTKREESLFGVPIQKLLPVFRKEIPRIERGEQTAVQLWRRLARETGVPPLPDRVASTLLSASFKKYGKINKATFSIAKKLYRTKLYSLGIISNTMGDHTALMKKWRLLNILTRLFFRTKCTRESRSERFLCLHREGWGSRPSTFSLSMTRRNGSRSKKMRIQNDTFQISGAIKAAAEAFACFGLTLFVLGVW